jgi:hypothetical protein
LAPARSLSDSATHDLVRLPKLLGAVPRVRPDRIIVNTRCLDNVESTMLAANRFFDGQNWEEAAKRYLATEQGHAR